MIKQNETKEIPNDVNAEIAVLGSILIDSDSIFSVKNILKREDFYKLEHQDIYKASLNIAERGEVINQITVARELNSVNRLSQVGGTAYLSKLISETPTSLLINSYTKIVKNLALYRQGISMAQRISDLSYDANDPDKYVGEIGKLILDLQSEVSLPKLIMPNDLAKRGMQRYGELRDGKRRGINTGYKTLDQGLGGLFGGELCYIGARPGVGKTEILLSMAEYASNNYGNILLASLEQPWGDILDRFVSRELEVTPRKIRAGNYSDDLFDNISNAMAGIYESKLYFYDSGGNIDGRGRNVSSIYSIANHMKNAYGLSAIFIDYLGLLNSDESWNRSRYEKVSEISFKLKALAIDLDIPVICACQLNRQTEARLDDREPKISEIRDSGNIEADADTILFLYREDYYEDFKDKALSEGRDIIGKAKIIIGKHRQFGEAVGHNAQIVWDTKKRCYIDG